MPDYTKKNGSKVADPGVAEYTETVVLRRPPATPPFPVPVIVGTARTGYPYNFDTLKKAGESAYGAFRYVTSDAEAHAMCGVATEIPIAFRNAQEKGLSDCFLANVAPLTRAQVIVTSAGPVNEFALYSRLFGAIGGHASVKFAAGVFSYKPVKNFALLSAAVLVTDKRILVEGQDPDYNPIGWMSPGMTVYLGDNDTPDFPVVVSATGRDLDATGQWQYYFDLTAATGTAVEVTTKYGCVVLLGEEELSTTFGAGTGQALVDWINQNCTSFAVQKEATFAGAIPITVAALTPIKDLAATWGAITQGTSPVAADADYLAFFPAYEATYWDQFRNQFNLVPRTHLLTASSAIAHGYAKTFAKARRAAGNPIQLILGAAYGAIVLAAVDATNPLVCTAALNNQDIDEFFGQFDRLPPALSMAARAFGMWVSGGSKFSITRKTIKDGTPTITKIWTAAERKQIIQGGGITYMLSPGATPEWQFTSGVSTNQDRATTWSSASNTTCMVAARNCIDEYRAGLQELLDAYSGLTGITEADLGSDIYDYNVQSRDKTKLIREFEPPTLEEDTLEAAWRVTNLSVDPPAETLFLGIDLLIKVG